MWGRTLLALLIALPISALAIGTAAHKLDELRDPCVAWGAGDAGAGRINPHDPCIQHSGHGQTRTEAFITMAAVHGVILLAAILAIWGAVGPRPKVMLLAGVLMVLEMVPTIFSVWPLALLTGAGFIYMGIKLQDRQRSSGSAMR